MYLIAIAWFYVVLMMAVAEALSSQGSLLGAVVTFVLYGLLPVSLLMYILGTPGRKRTRKAQEAAEAAAGVAAAATEAAAAAQAGPAGMANPQAAPASGAPTSDAPDGRGVAAGVAVAAVRKEP